MESFGSGVPYQREVVCRFLGGVGGVDPVSAVGPCTEKRLGVERVLIDPSRSPQRRPVGITGREVEGDGEGERPGTAVQFFVGARRQVCFVEEREVSREVGRGPCDFEHLKHDEALLQGLQDPGSLGCCLLP